MDITDERLQDCIKNGFPIQPLPVRIARTYAGGNEGKYVDAIYTGKDWASIDIEDIRKDYDDGPPVGSLFHLSDEALVYYFPIFILASLKDNDPEDIASTLQYSFLSPQTAPSYFPAFSRLDIPGKHAIALYIKFLEQTAASKRLQSEARKLLSTYWGDFLSKQP